MSSAISDWGELSLVGEVTCPVNLSIALSDAVSRCDSGCGVGSIAGDILLSWKVDTLETVGVFAGDDLVGDIDLARSGIWQSACCTCFWTRHSGVLQIDNPIPALRACRSFRPCRISSSSFLVRSSSS